MKLFKIWLCGLALALVGLSASATSIHIEDGINDAQTHNATEANDFPNWDSRLVPATCANTMIAPDLRLDAPPVVGINATMRTPKTMSTSDSSGGTNAPIYATPSPDDLQKMLDCCLRVDADGGWTCEDMATAISCAIDVSYDDAIEACADGNIGVIVFRGGVQIDYRPHQVQFYVPFCPPC